MKVLEVLAIGSLIGLLLAGMGIISIYLVAFWAFIYIALYLVVKGLVSRDDGGSVLPDTMSCPPSVLAAERAIGRALDEGAEVYVTRVNDDMRDIQLLRGLEDPRDHGQVVESQTTTREGEVSR